MTTEEYQKRIAKANEYRERAIKKRLEKMNSPEYKEKQREKYLIQIERRKNTVAKPKPIKKHQYTAKKLSSPYRSIFSKDINVCYITGDTKNVVPHHIFEAAGKTFSEKYGFILPLRIDWHEGYDYSIHTDRKLNIKYKRLCQEYWINTLNKTKENWIIECGKWY